MKNTLLSLLVLVTCQTLHAQTYTPTADNLKARDWFQDAKFGLFIQQIIR
jgi:alpha-L-fucosidase